MNTRMPTSTVVFFFFNFSMISLGRVWFVDKESSYVYIFLNLIELLVLITNNQ